MIRLTKLFVIPLLLGMAACATAPDEPVANIKSLGLVSALGDEFKVITVGTTVFNNASTSGDVTEWNVDGVILDALSQHLNDQYAVQTIAVDKQAMISDYTADAAALSTKLFGDAGSKFRLSDAVERSRISTETSETGEKPDALVVVFLAPQNGYGFKGNPDLTGYGTYTSSMFGMGSTVLFLGARIVVIDTNTNEEIRSRYLMPGYINSNRGDQKCYDCFTRSVSDDLFERKFEDLSPEQIEGLRAELNILLRDSVKYSLEMVGLTPAPTE